MIFTDRAEILKDREEVRDQDGRILYMNAEGQPRDSSSAAIVACGLLEAEKHVKAAEREAIHRLAAKMLASLYDNYRAPEVREGQGHILHGTYSKKSPYNTCTPEGVDEYTSWGDYFYMEALTRMKDRNWNSYWL
jgi:unsaturated chondroitin disaccharide hydrolase